MIPKSVQRFPAFANALRRARSEKHALGLDPRDHAQTRVRAMSDLVIVRDQGHVRVVRMNRPDKKNALTGPMYQSMAHAIERAEQDRVRCVVILGAPGVFTAGNDLAEFLAARESRKARSSRCHLSQGAGALGRAADSGRARRCGRGRHHDADALRLRCRRHRRAVLDAIRAARLGARGCLKPARAAPDGASARVRMLVMGRELDAAAAVACGLANVAVAPDQVDAEALKAGSEIAALSPEAVAASRNLMRGSADEIVARIDQEVGLFDQRLRSPEARAAFEAFLARKP